MMEDNLNYTALCGNAMHLAVLTLNINRHYDASKQNTHVKYEVVTTVLAVGLACTRKPSDVDVDDGP